MVMHRARAAGVGLMLTIGTRLDKFPRVLAIAEKYPDVYCTVGIHPHEADGASDVDAAKLLGFCSHPKVVGIGETGLDYYYDHSDRGAQRRCFRAHIRAARESGLPLIVHTRNADADTAMIMGEELEQGPYKALLHCFSSGQALAEQAVGWGFLVSFSGILTFRNAAEVHATAAALPLSSLLVETDAPYLAPVPHRGKRNEPAYVTHTAAYLAQLRGVGIAEIERQTNENFLRLFDKVPPAALGATPSA